MFKRQPRLNVIDKELLLATSNRPFAFGTPYQALKDNNVSLEVEDIETSTRREGQQRRGG